MSAPLPEVATFYAHDEPGHASLATVELLRVGAEVLQVRRDGWAREVTDPALGSEDWLGQLPHLNDSFAEESGNRNKVNGR